MQILVIKKIEDLTKTNTRYTIQCDIFLAITILPFLTYSELILISQICLLFGNAVACSFTTNITKFQYR